MVLRYLSPFRQTTLHIWNSAGMLKWDKRAEIPQGNPAGLCSGWKGCRLLCSPPLPCRPVLGESPCEPISITQQQASTFSFFSSFFFLWVGFLMFWCIESVNERASLVPEPAQGMSGRLQRVVPAQRRRGTEGPQCPTLGAGVTCRGWQKPRSICLSEVFT